MQKTNPTSPNSNLKTGLILWAKKHGVTPATFSEIMGYAYVTAWQILRGRHEFTSEAFGRFTLNYGTHQAAELLKLANVPDGTVSFANGSETAASATQAL